MRERPTLDYVTNLSAAIVTTNHKTLSEAFRKPVAGMVAGFGQGLDAKPKPHRFD